MPETQNSNISTKPSNILKDCKVPKLKHLCKEDTKTHPKGI